MLIKLSDKNNQHEAITLLVNTMPDLKIRWENYINQTYKNSTERHDYVDIGEISWHLVDRIKANQTQDFVLFFAALENIYGNCDADTETLMTVGLLEGLQNICGWEHIDYHHGFDEWLLPKTKKCWQDVIDFWE